MSPAELKKGFRIAEFEIRPLEGQIVGPDGPAHLQPKSADVLMCLAAHAGDVVERDQIMAEVWGEHAVSDESLTRCIADLRHHFGDHRGDTGLIETVPKRGYRLAATVAPLSEIEQGDGATSTETEAQTPRHFIPSLTAYSLIGVVVLGLGYFLIQGNFIDLSNDDVTKETRDVVQTDGERRPSVAVLPFTNISQDVSNDPFTAGIHDDLITHIAKISSIKTISRTSVMQYRETTKPIAQIADELGVTTIVEGGVQRSGDRVRINVQLIDAATDAYLWAESYDRQLTAGNLFDIQRQIATSIADSLEAKLSPEEQDRLMAVPTENLAAHEAYLRGRILFARRSSAVLGAIREFEKAVALDPNYAAAYAELGLASLIQAAYYRRDPLLKTEFVIKASHAVEQALILDPDLAQTQAAKGFLSREKGNFEDAEVRYRRAIEIDPNYADAYNWLQILLVGSLGRYDEGFVTLEAALQLDPISIVINYNYANELIHRNRLAEADEVLEKIAWLGPWAYEDIRAIRASLGGRWANRVLGDLEILLLSPKSERYRINLAQKLARLGVEYETLLALEPPVIDVLRILGRHADAISAAEASVAMYPDSLTTRSELGMALAGAGFDARALPILEEAWQTSSGKVTSSGTLKINAAAALIHARRSAGDERDVSELVDAINDNVHRYRKAGETVASWNFSADYEEGLAYFLSGERETGLELIHKAAAEGFFIPLHEAYLDELYDDPGFAQIKEIQSDRQARERNRFFNIVCTDNPYAAVWQPAAETCERFGTAGEI